MVTQNTNPFVLPGFGQSGEMATNPMLASMEMMRKAWEGLANASGLDATQMVPGTSPEDLERRIADLRAVENWLRMNLSMLSSSIQALEVQRSTMATLQAFVASAGGGTNTEVTPSPLDVALGIRRGADVAPSADSTGLFGDKAQRAQQPGQATGADAATQKATSEAPKDSGSTGSGGDAASSAPDPATTAMKSWWDMLQTQFDNLASATAAGLQSTEALKEAATEAQKKAMESTRVAAEAMKESAGAAPAPAKKTAKKAAAKKSPAKKAAKKSAAKRTAAKKASAKKSATSKKTASVTRGANKS